MVECTLQINREGEFTIDASQDSVQQCGNVGKREYKYFVSIKTTNKHLNKVGYVMENMLVDDYFQTTYGKEQMTCDSCENMAQRAIADLKKILKRENPKAQVIRIYVRLHGTPKSFIEAEYINKKYARA